MLMLNLIGFTPQEALELISIGLETRRQWVLGKINEIKTQIADLDGGKPRLGRPPASQALKPVKTAPKAHRPHILSAAARENIAEAQRKRWLRFHREKRAQQRAKTPHKPKPRVKPAPPPAENEVS